MNSLKLTVFLTLVFASTAFAGPQLAPLLPESERSPTSRIPEDARLIKTVMLMRNGVRAPVESSEELATWTENAWPQWPVPRTYLTERGSKLMQANGKKTRDRLNFQKLFTAGLCPEPASVQVYADNEQRTMASAAAFLAGFAPDCDLYFSSLDNTAGIKAGMPTGIMSGTPAGANSDTSTGTSQGMTAVAKFDSAAVARLDSSAVARLDSSAVAKLDSAAVAKFDSSAVAKFDSSAEKAWAQAFPISPGIDPLFSPTEAGIVPTEAQRAAIAKEAAPLLPMLSQDLAPQLSLIQSLIGPHPALCASYQLPADCTLNDIPTRVHQEFRSATANTPAYYKAELSGALAIGRSIAEMWLMESAQWPDKPVAWGLLPPSAVSTLLPTHSRTFYALNAVPTLVHIQGAPLLMRILSILHENSPVLAENAAPLVIFMGHDTNIASVSALLNLTWRQQAYPHNTIAPGSALVFTLWDWQGTKLVGMYFTSQSLSVLQSNDENVLNTSEKLLTVLRLDGISPVLNHDTLYPLASFTKRVNEVLK